MREKFAQVREAGLQGLEGREREEWESAMSWARLEKGD